MDEAMIHGVVRVCDGVDLITGTLLIEEQKCWGEDDHAKDKKFHEDCFYIVSDDGYIDEVDEDELGDCIAEGQG